MKKTITLFWLFFVTISFGQVVLNETFDNNTAFTTSTPFFSDGFSDYFGLAVVNDYNGDSNPNNIKAYTGFSGGFLAGMDLDGEGATLPITTTWTGLDITGLTSLSFSGEFAEFFDNPGDIDAADFILVEYQIDGGGYQNLIAFEGTNFSSGTNNGVFAEDTNFDGTGDGTVLTGTAQSFTKAIAGTGTTLDLRLTVSVNSGDEDFAVDSFSITGVLAAGNPPTISCPADVVVGNDAGVCSAVVNFAEAIAIDPDGDLDTVLQTGGLPSGSAFPVGVNTVEFTATDLNGNTAVCSFTITVNDTEDPVAVCQDITVEVDPATGSVSITPADIDNGSTDNCGIASMSLDVSTFTCADIGVVPVVLTVTDATGNTATCNANVTVEDNTAPVISCIGESTIGTTVFINEIHYDNQGGDVGEFIEIAGPAGTDLSTYELILYNGNGGTEYNTVALAGTIDDEGAGYGALSFSISGIQNGAPDGIVLAENGTVVQFLSYEGSFTATNGIASGMTSLDIGVSESSSTLIGESLQLTGIGSFYDDFSWNNPLPESPGMLNIGQTLQTPPPSSPLDVVLDASGNATLPASALLQSVDEACGYTVTVGGGGGTANTLTTTFAGGNSFDGNMFDVVALNDLTIESFDVNLGTGVTDDVEVWYRTGTFVGNETSSAGWTLLGTAVNITSAGDGVPTPLNMSLGLSITAGDTIAFYVTTVNGGTMNYTNGTAVGNLFASDANLEFYEGNGGGYFNVTFSPRIFNGNIHYTTGGGTSIDFDCSMLGENLIEVTVTDASGNESTCMATVNVIDNTAPVITCGPQDTVTNAMEDFETTTIPSGWSTDITAGSQDWEFGSGDLPIGDDFPTWAAIFNDDAAGNGAVNAGSLISPVYDLTGVSVATLSYEVAFQEFGDQEFYVEVWDGAAWQQVALYDEDLNPNIQAVSIDVLAYANANFQVRFRYDDLGGWGWHAAIDNFQVSYTVPPASSNVIIELDENGEAVIDPYDLLSSIDEACGIGTVAVDVTDVSCADIGTPIDVTVFISDTSGNIAACVATIEVVDNLAPVVTCPADQTVEVDPQTVLYEVPDYFGNGEASALDNCTDPVTIFTQDPAPGSFLADGVYTVTLTAEDEYGNVGTCTFELTVETVLGAQDNVLSNVSMYPNPANEYVTIANGTGVQLERAVIYDVNGKLVNTIDLQDMTTEKTIDVSALASGVYMVQITSKNASVVKRLIKE